MSYTYTHMHTYAYLMTILRIVSKDNNILMEQEKDLLQV